MNQSSVFQLILIQIQIQFNSFQFSSVQFTSAQIISNQFSSVQLISPSTKPKELSVSDTKLESKQLSLRGVTSTFPFTPDKLPSYFRFYVFLHICK